VPVRWYHPPRFELALAAERRFVRQTLPMPSRILTSSAAGPALTLLVGFVCSCATTSDLDNLRRRASFEMNCPESQIRISNLDDQNETYGVNACGERAVYIWHCGADGLDCKWVQNTTTRSQ